MPRRHDARLPAGGLSIAEIRPALAGLPEGHIPGPAGRNRLAQRLRHELRHRIDDLNRALQALSPYHPPNN
jgi:DNA-binding transcriptional MerR regulator